MTRRESIHRHVIIARFVGAIEAQLPPGLNLSAKLASTAMTDIMMVGKGRAETVNTQNMAANIVIHSYASLISAARGELDWLITSLSG